MPQDQRTEAQRSDPESSDTRTPQQRADFKRMLKMVNLLYLGCRVLILLDKSYFGRFWNDQLTRGFRQLQFLDARQYMEIRFEDLITEPAETLRGLAAFFELPEGDWIARSAALVRGLPAPRLPELPDDEQSRLVQACLAGNQLLGRA